MNPIIRAGKDAEKDARWHLDRCFARSKNWRVFHDLTFPDHKSDSPCQIDHVAISRLSDMIVFETKSAVNGMKLDQKTGAWSVYFSGRPKPMPSPVEQNKRHIDVIRHFFNENEVYPRRLGIPIRPRFHSWILVQPGVSLPLIYDNAWIVQRDHIDSRFEVFIDKIGVTDVLGMIGFDELDDVGRFLESFQTKPLFKQPEVPETIVAETPPESFAPKSRKCGTFCENCDEEIDGKVAAFCRFNAARFNGRYLCRKCQSLASK